MAPIRFTAISLVFALAATPAFAQFDRIFRDEPPRPPANVPSAPPAPRPDEPPAEPLPAPMNLPPSSRPGIGGVESKPLAPLPGAPVAPLPPANERPQGPTQRQTGPAQPVPGVTPGKPQAPASAQPADTAPPSDEVVVAPPPQRIDNPTAIFSGLDKITGRITTFDVAINETVQFGALQVTPRVCYSRPPTEAPDTDAFVEVDEVTLQNEIKRIFTGWMFAASPGLHAVEHPIYDVWLTDCKGGKNPALAEAPPEPQQPAAKPAARPAPKPPVRRAPAQPGFLPALR